MSISPTIERSLFIGVIFVSAGSLLSASLSSAAASRAVPVIGQDLYENELAQGNYPQMIDIRPLVDDENIDVGGYEDIHLPKSIPVPHCDPDQAPDGVANSIRQDKPTIIISADGDEAAFAACAERYPNSRNLQGGVVAWVDDGFPEDFGEWVKPAVDGMAGGGCL